MSRPLLRLLAVLLLVAGTTSCLAAQAPAGVVARPSPAAERHPVAAYFDAGIAAFNAHDLDTFMQQFADDLEMYTPTGWLRGKAAVRERFVTTFRDFPSVRMIVRDLRVRDVAPGVAVVDFAWSTYPRGAGPAYHGVGSGTYVRRDGRWQEVLEHETVVSIDSALAPPASRRRPAP
jgi:uncharacterized protein (TIGR02246 family)